VLENLAIRDRERALLNLAAISGRVTSNVMRAMPLLLAESPDPDTALNGFERFTATATPQLLRLLDRQPRLIHYALVVFGYSPYLGDTLIQNADVLSSLAKAQEIERSYSTEDYRLALSHFQKSASTLDPSLGMARFRRRQYIRIMLRDVLGIATLADTTAELSSLADALIGEALTSARAELSNRLDQHDGSGDVSVISLGKLGGNELNYSSDIDLLFLYSAENDKGAGAASAREYFIRLAQRTTELLSRMAAEGPVYRVDLRLRPRGAEGEPAVGITQALRYYAEEAHDWELQAMIKARHTAGDEALAREFLQRVEPFIYRATLNFAAIETALVARRRMAKRKAGGLWARSTQPGIDVKVGRGGIRDIEFLAQCLQRVYAGQEPWLRSRGTLFALQKLHDKGHLSGRDYQELNSAYVFLRTVEHRLQLRHGQQTHRIPEACDATVVLGRSVAAVLAEAPPERITQIVVQRMAAVAEIYGRIVHQQEVQQTSGQPSPDLELTPASDMGVASFQQVLRRLATDSPRIHNMVAETELSAHGRRNLFRFFASAMTSSDRYATVLAHPHGVERALQLLDTSDLIADVLIRYPEEIATLEHLESEGFAIAADPNPGVAKSSDEQLANLRRQYRRLVLVGSASDLFELRNVYSALQASSIAAIEAISFACDQVVVPPGLAVLALGRLGTLEFDYGSDADLIFVHHPSLTPAGATEAARAIVQAIAAYTRDGVLFSVDTRLRPRGNEGELVITPEQLGEYFAREAQAWEALSYTKLRPVAGNSAIAAQAMEQVRQHFPRFACDPQFTHQLREMRARLETKDGERELNFKTSRGGIYDIDFIASAALVTHGMPERRGNLHETLGALRNRGLIDSGHAQVLMRGAEILRTLDHATRLVTGRARKWLPASERPAVIILQLAAAMLRIDTDALRAEMSLSMTAARASFDELLPLIATDNPQQSL
jgi:glutamate-ammonia-ligase adenylyltransferase